MRYGITKAIFGDHGFIEIDKVEYEQIKDALSNLIELLVLEENLDLVMENFQEYEAELLLMASRRMVFQDNDILAMSNQRVIMSRRIVNLLSACRMYLDQSMHHLNNIYEDNSAIAKEVEQETSSQYEHSLGYRVMEALRNYVQHRGFPIHGLEFSSEWLNIHNKDKSRLSYTVIPKISISELAQDKKFKRAIVKEMKNFQDEDGIDIRPLIRDYVEGIGKIHEKIRKLTQPDVTKWESIINGVILKFQSMYEAEVSLAGLSIVAVQDNNRKVVTKVIRKDYLQKRKNLENKNRAYVNFRKRFASNEIRQDDV